MKATNRLSICATLATGLLMAGQATATIYDFSVGFTNGPLNGQSGFIAGADLVISGGELIMSTTNEWETGTVSISNTNNEFTISSWFTFDQTGPKGSGQEIQRIILNDVSGGATPISAILRRSNTVGSDVYVLQTKTDQAGAAANQGWQTFSSSLLGFAAGDAAGSSDDLMMSITFEKGTSADTWSSHVVLSNLTTGTEIKSESRIGVFNVTDNMHNAATYYGGVNGSHSDVNAGVANRIVTQLEVAAAYTAPPTWDTVFEYDMAHLDDSKPFSDTAGWGSLNQWGWGFINTNATAGSRLVHRPKSTETEFETNKKGWDWRGVIYTNGLPRTVDAGETIEFKVDYTMFAHTALANRNGIDFFFSTNGISWPLGWSGEHLPSQQYFGKDPAGQIGFRVRQGSWNNSGNWPDGNFQICMDPANPTTSQGSINLNDIGITNITGGISADLQSNPMALTFTAFKTETAGVWDLTLTIQNQFGGTLKTIEQNSWTNDALYNATEIYFGMYGYHMSVAEEGAELDNMRCRINWAEAPIYTTWEQFEIDYGLTNGVAGDQDMDGENNWYEYVLCGDPTNAGVQGVLPSFDAATGEYGFSLRGDTDLTYYVLTRGNLMIGSWATNATDVAPADDGALHVITETIGTTADQEFMKLLVE
ncbi:hypothetical protein P4B35_15270 [Pontiellaceae bacterium B12227]|nr:hypothetical protein [Pontiellaceae bacterium B12227]